MAARRGQQDGENRLVRPTALTLHIVLTWGQHVLSDWKGASGCTKHHVYKHPGNSLGVDSLSSNLTVEERC